VDSLLQLLDGRGFFRLRLLVELPLALEPGLELFQLRLARVLAPHASQALIGLAEAASPHQDLDLLSKRLVPAPAVLGSCGELVENVERP
jgi:hypothetical protein